MGQPLVTGHSDGVYIGVLLVVIVEELQHLNKKDLLKLFAIVTLSDGYLYKRFGKPKNIRLITSPGGDSQHDYFEYLCLQLFNRKPRRRSYIKKSTNQKFLLSELNYRAGITKLYALSPEFNTTPGNKSKTDYLRSSQPSLKFLFNENENLQWLAFRTYFDFDGSIVASVKLKNKKDKKKGKTYNYFQVQFECEVQIAETNPQLVHHLVLLCNNLGLRATIKKDKRNWSQLSGVCITERKSIRKFLEMGGPLTNVQISKKGPRLAGFTKKKICRNLLNVLLLPNFKFSKSFKEKATALEYQSQFNKILFEKLTS